MKAAVILAVLSVLAAACGGDGGGEGDGERASLLERLPDDDVVAWVDLVEVREQLGLEPDDELADPDDDAGWLALGAVTWVIPYLAVPQPDLAVKVAIDIDQVTSAASNHTGFDPDRAVIVLATGQEPEQIAAAFEAAGWSEDDGLVVAPEDASVRSERYTAVGFVDGLVVLGQGPDAVRSVVDGEIDGPSPAAEWVDEVDGPLRSAVVTDPDECFGAVAISEDFIDGGGGELVVAAGEATTDDVPYSEGDTFDARGLEGEGFYTADSVDLTDGRLEVEWSATEDFGAASLVSIVVGDLDGSTDWILACP